MDTYSDMAQTVTQLTKGLLVLGLEKEARLPSGCPISPNGSVYGEFAGPAKPQKRDLPGQQISWDVHPYSWEEVLDAGENSGADQQPLQRQRTLTPFDLIHIPYISGTTSFPKSPYITWRQLVTATGLN